MTSNTQTLEAVDIDTSDSSSVVDAVCADGVLVEDEMLVEEISIDGMCGVY